MHPRGNASFACEPPPSPGSSSRRKVPVRYLGQYIADARGRLVFQEGPLVRAVRAGQWVVLDELNLAPSEVLEALNRLLDDNREIFIAETNETVKAHPDFAVFATQNPAGGAYGGRKVLSRAFRNRFVELFVDDIPPPELASILHWRCGVAPKVAETIVASFQDLQARRAASQVFSGKRSFATVRDLLRWGNRQPASGEEIATQGYRVLAERLRDPAEQESVEEQSRAYGLRGLGRRFYSTKLIWLSRRPQPTCAC